MNPRQPGHTPATDFDAEVDADLRRLFTDADNQSKGPSKGLIDSGDEWNVSAPPVPPSRSHHYTDDDLDQFRLLGEARSIIAELTSPYWDHKAQGRAREWLRRYDDRHETAMRRMRGTAREGGHDEKRP